MKNIKNDYCIRLFTATGDNYRPWFNHIALDNGYLYATNAHIIGKIKADLCIKPYDKVDKFPNCEKLFLDHVSFDTKKISVNSLFNDLMKTEVCFKPKMINCLDCSGSGEQICEYCDSEHDCNQ